MFSMTDSSGLARIAGHVSRNTPHNYRFLYNVHAHAEQGVRFITLAVDGLSTFRSRRFGHREWTPFKLTKKLSTFDPQIP